VECHNIVHWRRIAARGPQFYHWRRNPECPLCSYGEGWDEEYYKQYLGINYKERWVETIDELRYFGNFEWIKDKEWAINPLKFYLAEIERNRPTETDAIFDAKSLLEELCGNIKPLITLQSDKNFIDMAKTEFAKKNFYKAIEYYSNALSMNPNHAFAYNGRGRAHRRNKCYDEALNDFNRALRINPGYGAALNNIGVVFVDKKEFDKAIEYFTKSLDDDPYSIVRLFNRGKAYHFKNELENAIADYLKIIDIPSIGEKKKKDVCERLSKAYLELGDKINAEKYTY
jgi:tetratricopeptide (TPR) repeat protein